MDSEAFARPSVFIYLQSLCFTTEGEWRALDWYRNSNPIWKTSNDAYFAEEGLKKYNSFNSKSVLQTYSRWGQK